MLDRRRFLQAVAATPLVFAASAHAHEEAPDFAIAGSQVSDPPGYAVAWSEDWELRTDLSTFQAKTEPGQRGFIILDADSSPGFPESNNRRTVLETVLDPAATDPEAYIAAIPDNRMELQGYAPGTYIHSRHVTERGGWICYAANVEDHSRALRGLELYFLPQSPGDPVLTISAVTFSPSRDEEYSPEGLAAIDSSISISGDWLLGRDELDAYWQALEAVSYGPPS